MCRENSHIVLPDVQQSAKASASSSSEPTAGTRQLSENSQTPPSKELTLRALLGTGLNKAKVWCRGFAHGTHYAAFLCMTRSKNPAILPYNDLPPNLQKAGRRTEWKKKCVFFRIVKKTRRIINSVGSTGSSGGVILFMPIDKSLDFKLYSLSGSDTQTFESPATPKKVVFDSLETSENLSIAEIAFGEGISLSYISKVFLLDSTETTSEREAAVKWLLKNGFQQQEEVQNSKGTYQHFARRISESSPSSLRSMES